MTRSMREKRPWVERSLTSHGKRESGTDINGKPATSTWLGFIISISYSALLAPPLQYKEAINCSREFQPNNLAVYYFNTIKHPRPLRPTNQDIPSCSRIKPTWIMEAMFKVGESTYKLIDVSGKRSVCVDENAVCFFSPFTFLSPLMPIIIKPHARGPYSHPVRLDM